VGVFVGAWAAVRAIDPSIINLSKGRGGAADCGGDFSRPRTLICGMSMIQRAEGD
jgi:hypothetical protein